MNKTKKGISLIVLVITIIVMIILATAIILSLNGSNIIGKANEAKTKSDIANAKYVVSLAKAEWKLMSEKEREKAGDSVKKYVEDKLKEVGIKDIQINDKGDIVQDGEEAIKGTYIYVDSAKKTAPIPEGFTVSTIPGETTIAGGLVIYEGTEPVTPVDSDSNGIIDAQETRNQFVWVPVDDYTKFQRTTTYKPDEAIKAPATAYNEPASSVCTYSVDYGIGTECEDSSTLSLENDLTGEWKEEQQMRASVKQNGGFYIGRYEAGTTIKRESGSDSGKDNKTTELVVQKDKFVYNYVAWGIDSANIEGEIGTSGYNYGIGAVKLSRNMYNNSKSVVSTLCYGVQWDSALRFIASTTEHANYPMNSSGKGNYTGNLLNTGSNEAYKTNNIYDMAGNVMEWTMEDCTGFPNTSQRVIRGGSYWHDATKQSASTRACSYPMSSTPDWLNEGVGYRVALYIK